MDIDLFYKDNDENGDYGLTFSDNAKAISGNKLLLNRFQTVLFDNGFDIMFSDENNNLQKISDTYGGGFTTVVTDINMLKNNNVLMASMSIIVQNTLYSLKENDALSTAPDTEKIESAEIVSFGKEGDVVNMEINIKPVEIDNTVNLNLTVPIVKYAG